MCVFIPFPWPSDQTDEVTIEVKPAEPVEQEEALMNVEVTEQFTLTVNTEPAGKEEC